MTCIAQRPLTLNLTAAICHTHDTAQPDRHLAARDR
jgi:hypothetical protein